MPNGISAYHLYLNKQLRLIGLNPFPPSQTLHTQLSSGNGDEDDGEDVDGDEVEDNDEYGDEDDDQDGDISIMTECLSVCLSVTKNDHFLLGVSCNHLNPP